MFSARLFFSVVFQSKVKVRRASISEPSDTDYEPRPLSSTQGLFSKHVISKCQNSKIFWDLLMHHLLLLQWRMLMSMRA